LENNKKVILVVGAAAVILALILYIAFLPETEEDILENPLVKELELQALQATTQVDSLNIVVDDLNSRIDIVRTQMDSARTSNQVLLASLQRVTTQMKEYQRLYQEQRSLTNQLQTEIAQVKSERDRATTQARELKTAVDSLNNELYEQTIRLTRMESSLEQALSESSDLRKTVTSVLVYVGTEDELKQKGFLETSRPALFSKNYKISGFPDIASNDANIRRIPLGETFTLEGKLKELCDRHGKLGKGKEFEISQGPPGQTMITFTDSMLVGQRVLAVLE
jgi:hypothetical protein